MSANRRDADLGPRESLAPIDRRTFNLRRSLMRESSL